MTHFLIAGGGISGLTTALALQLTGYHRITVVEAAPGPRPGGAGLNLMPNAVRELDALGLLADLERRCLPTRELRYYHRTGALISGEPRGRGAGHRWPQLSIPREVLLEVLADAVRERLGPAAIVGGVRVTAVDPASGERPRVQLDHHDGVRRGSASLEPDVLIGADGIRSAVRASLYPDEGEPPWNGMLVWRGVSRVPPDRIGDFMFIAGDDRRKAVVYPMTPPDPATGTVLVNWALALPAALADPGTEAGAGGGPDPGTGSGGHGPAAGVFRGDWNRPVPHERFLRHFRGWEFDGVRLEEILNAADRAYEYPMVDREPLPCWSHGRTTLIGDAAHAMYPIGSNGATQSVVDGRALAHALAHHRDPAEALAVYEADRRPVTTGLQLANRELGPEVVINLAHQRAPGGFTDIDRVVPPAERARIAARYAVAGAFDQDTVNAGSPYCVTVPPRG
jgi:5-methylphenazine-1-carboxylate 1-monooxygenase